MATLCVLGCGNLGTAILRGIFTATSNNKPNSSSSTSITPPTKFTACVASTHGAQRVETSLAEFKDTHPLQIFTADNAAGIHDASAIILACEPSALQSVLEPLRSQLSNKLLISILAGVTVDKIRGILANDSVAVARVLPNTAAAIGESCTAFANDSGLSDGQRALVNWIFSCVGTVVEVPTKNMDVATALSGSGIAFALSVLEGFASGGVALGLSPGDAQRMFAQVMKGAGQLVLNGGHPGVLKDQVTTPGGCTIAGLCSMEEGGVRGGCSRAVREATTVVGQLGRGVANPNRTRLD